MTVPKAVQITVFTDTYVSLITKSINSLAAAGQPSAVTSFYLEQISFYLTADECFSKLRSFSPILLYVHM